MLRVTSLFSGIGAFEQALTNLNVVYDVVNFCEIDKFAIKNYCKMHNVDESLNLGDISRVVKLQDCDLLTYGFPCTDVSLIGKMEGLSNNTRSGLLWEVERLLEVSNKPKYLIMENVKNLVGKQFKPDFDKWLKKLENFGYKNYWAVLNSKDFGVPQTRERVYCISILGDENFKFPTKRNVNFDISTVLESEVNVSFYLNKTTQKVEDKLKTVNLKNAPIVCEQRCDEGLRFFKDNICGTLRTIDSCGDKRIIESNGKIRKLTPRECWRLQGFPDYQFEKCRDTSNSQLYKQAGNSITVNVLESIFKNLLKGVDSND